MGHAPNSDRPDVPTAMGSDKPDLGLPPSRRMPPAAYKDTFAQNRSFPGRFLVLWMRTAADADRRLGVVTSRRSLHTAVMRNRARRLLRETFRLHRHCLRPDVDVLLVARTRIMQVKRQDVDVDFRAVCRKAGIWRSEAC
jgi:ribonuclease P protein component